MDDEKKLEIGKKTSGIALLVNISLMISKAAVGIISHSTAIIAEALNNGTDIFATLLVFGGLRIAYLPPDEKHQYGHAKAESIVSKIVGMIVIFTGIAIGYSAVKQILSGRVEVQGYLSIAIALISIFVKYFLFKYTYRIGSEINSSSIIADSYNHRADVMASFAALIGVASSRAGFPIMDPIAGLVVSIIIFKTGISIYLEAIDALMDTAPSPKVIKEIKNKVLEVPGVIKINGIRARKQGSRLHVDLKICVNGNISVENGHFIASKAKRNVLKSNDDIQDIMIHVDPCNEEIRKNNFDCLRCKNNI